MASTTRVEVAPAEMGSAVAGLVGKRVLEVLDEPTSGSLLDLGEWVRRPRPIPNEHLNERQRNFRGSDSVFVRCTWVLDSPVDLGLVVDETDWWSRMLSRMDLIRSLIDQTVSSAEFSASDLSLTLAFDPLGATLKLEPPLKGGDLTECSVGLGGQFWIVQSDGKVFRETPAA